MSLALREHGLRLSAERRRKRLLLRQLRAGLEYTRSVVRARAAAALLPQSAEKNFKNRKTAKK
jgi:hypothetical protein